MMSSSGCQRTLLRGAFLDVRENCARPETDNENCSAQLVSVGNDNHVARSIPILVWWVDSRSNCGVATNPISTKSLSKNQTPVVLPMAIVFPSGLQAIAVAQPRSCANAIPQSDTTQATASNPPNLFKGVDHSSSAMA